VITKSFPPAKPGVPYRECVTLNGTLPINLVSHNLGEDADVSIVGNQLCISIENPTGPADVAVLVRSACKGCKAETVVGSIELATEDGCGCIPMSYLTPNLPNAVVGQPYFGTVQLGGTGPFEICGYSVPKCMKIVLRGNLVEISGTPEVVGMATFTARAKCDSCAECLGFGVIVE
jgi:hypothetical protein